METFDTFLTYAYDFVLGGGSLYIGTALVVHLVDRWNKLEVKPKVAAPAVNLPLALKAPDTEGIALEARERQALSTMSADSTSRDPQPALPLQPSISQAVSLPEPEQPPAAEPPASTAEPLNLSLFPEPAAEPDEV